MLQIHTKGNVRAVALEEKSSWTPNDICHSCRTGLLVAVTSVSVLLLVLLGSFYIHSVYLLIQTDVSFLQLS